MKLSYLPIALVLLGLNALAVAQPTVALKADTVIDPAAWNFPEGKYGTTVNGQTFQQEAVVTHAGYQYASFFADGGILAIGRRKLPDGAWEVIRFSDYKAKDHRDAHNVASMGICETDGTIHLMFDHHNNDLRYRRSVPGLASKPAEMPWNESQFGPITSKLDGTTRVQNVTYPQIYPTPNGKLQVMYRLGASGDGDWYLAEYDPSAGGGTWTILGIVLSSKGRYQTSPSRCGYPNPLRYDADNRLHMTWTWREAPENTPFDLRTNHDLLYAYSEDFGRTWRNNAGETIADLTGQAGGNVGKSITIDSPGTIAQPTKFLWGQMNTTTQFIDSKGCIHVINWQNPHDATAGTKDLNQWKYYHYVRSADGTWKETLLPFVGRKPQLVVDTTGNAIVAYVRGDNANYHGTDPGGKLTIAVATEASGWTDWKTTWTADRPSVGEPLLDHARWKAESVLSVYLQDKPAQPGAPSPLRVIDFSVSPGGGGN